MTTIGDQSNVDLNEVLKQIQQATASQYKDADGKPYTHVSIQKLRHWFLSLEQAKTSASGVWEIEKALTEAKDQVQLLMKAAESKDLRLQELRDLVANAEKALKSTVAEHASSIAKLKQSRDHAISQHKEAQAASTATAKALAEARAALKDPKAKFVPEEAVKLAREVKDLETDLADANAMIAAANADKAKFCTQLDQTHKLVAAKTRELDETKAELSAFTKRLAAARLGNAELFNLEDIDYERLKVVFGEQGLAKLRLVLGVETWDVRGRIQKLTGFFAATGRTLAAKMQAFVKLMTHALDVLKTSSTVWTAVLAPWVNTLIKDIVMLELKPVAVYRIDLETKIKAVKAAGPAAGFKIKLAAASGTSKGLTWAEVAKARRERVSHLLKGLKTKINALTKRIKAFARSAYKRFTAKSRKIATTCATVTKKIFGYFGSFIDWTTSPFRAPAKGPEEQNTADEAGVDPVPPIEILDAE